MSTRDYRIASPCPRPHCRGTLAPNEDGVLRCLACGRTLPDDRVRHQYSLPLEEAAAARRRR